MAVILFDVYFVLMGVKYVSALHFEYFDYWFLLQNKQQSIYYQCYNVYCIRLVQNIQSETPIRKDHIPLQNTAKYPPL